MVYLELLPHQFEVGNAVVKVAEELIKDAETIIMLIENSEG
ncbi:hypothetical protein [Methanococcoides orientis]|nr:hypothetical protein [Methanococcoides orientis]